MTECRYCHHDLPEEIDPQVGKFCDHSCKVRFVMVGPKPVHKKEQLNGKCHEETGTQGTHQ